MHTANNYIANKNNYMAKECAITKKGSIMAGGYSNRTRATKFNPTGMVRKYPNIHKRRIFVAELGKTFVLPVSTRGLRTINKLGAFKALKKAGIVK